MSGAPFKMKGSPFQRNFGISGGKVKSKGLEPIVTAPLAPPDTPGKVTPKVKPKAYASQTKMKKTGRTLPHPSHTVTPPSKEEAEKSKGTLKGQTGFESDFPIVSKFMKVTNPVSQAKRTIKSGKQIVKGVSKGVKSIKKYFTER